MDKIRILWIDDRHQRGLPESTLPDPFRKYFKIVDPRDQLNRVEDSGFWFPDVEQFVAVLERFWCGDTNLLPCEILATDYDLSKPPLGSDAYGTSEIADQEFIVENNDFRVLPPAETTTVTKASRSLINFDGLIISAIFSCITCRHPSALVSMTSLMGQMPYGVRALQKMAEPFVGARFEQNLGALERSWENILFIGLPHLRRRIGKLYEDGDIVISTDDLMSLAESPDYQTLTIQSPFAKRRWPVQGLFIDVPESKRYAQIHEWAMKLVQLKVNFEVFKQARELSELVWTAYESRGDVDLVKERAKLSLLAARKKGDKGGRKKPILVFGSFKIQGDDEVEPFVDIRAGAYSKDVRRWAVLLIIIKLISHFIVVKKRLEEYIEESIEGPVPNAEDIYLALFPLPKNPVILPWHIERTGKNWKNRFNTWEQYLGRLQLNIRDVMMGKDLSEGVSKGLRPSERKILQGVLVGYKDIVKDCKLEESPYAQWGPAHRILWGEEPEVS